MAEFYPFRWVEVQCPRCMRRFHVRLEFDYDGRAVDVVTCDEDLAGCGYQFEVEARLVPVVVGRRAVGEAER